MRSIVALAALVALSGCAGYVKQARTVQQQLHADKMATVTELIGGACDLVLVTDVRDAIMARPSLRTGLPILCPDSIGALFGLLQQPAESPVTLRIELVPPGAGAAAE